MRALVLHAPQDLRVERQATEAPGPGEVHVRIAAGGICGSDLHYYHHGGVGDIRLREPMILGHEVAGHVVATGAGVERLTKGQLVAVSPSRPCRVCQYCERGLTNHCENMQFYGSAMRMPHVQGAFRDELVATEAQCVLADGLSPGIAATAEPLAVCLHAVERAGPLIGRKVLVTGCGPIGALTILAARQAGAAEVVATDLAPSAREMARAVGADVALDAADPEALAPWTEGKGQIDTAFECAGAVPALAACIAALRPQGILVQVGLGGDATVPLQKITAKEIDLRGAFRFHPEFAMAVDLMQRGLIDPSPLISHTVPMAEAESAFALATDRSQAMKVQLDFTN